ncbi:SLOW WALKER 2-like protein [Drosera capensis]
MSTPKPKKKPTKPQDIDTIKSDVASFASSLGLSSSLLSSGFNDIDFRKPHKPKTLDSSHSKKSGSWNQSDGGKNPRFQTPGSGNRRDGEKDHRFQRPGSGNQGNGGKTPRFQRPSSGNQRGGNENARFQRPSIGNQRGGDKNPRFQKPNSQFQGNDRRNHAFQNKYRSNDAVNDEGNGEMESGSGDYRSFERFRDMSKLPLVKANALGMWHVDVAELEAKVMGGEKKRAGGGDAEEWKRLVEEKRELGERLLAQYTLDYEASRGQSGDIKMLLTTQRSGTAADKVSAHSVLIGDNPIANMRSLDALLAMVSSKVGKRHALTAFEALKELFIQSLLPDRKFKALFQQPLSHLSDTKDGNSLLLFWYWEDCLKSRYERFISALEEASRDMLAILKDKALKTMYVLLKSKSEQERRLLSSLVNKLGDPENKVASNADFHLSNLLSEHPNMKVVVIDEVNSFLFRPHLALKAKYHAVNFLSKIRLSHHGDGPKVAKRLIDVYFALFMVLISDAGAGLKTSEDGKMDAKKAPSKGKGQESLSESHIELDSRLLSVLLTGVNRAFPFVSGDEADEIIEVQTPMLFRLVHSKNFNVGIQALMLLDKISSKNQVASDRFYRALYAKLLLPAAMNSSKEEMFIGLLLRAMKSDINIKRVAAFAKRMLQVVLQQPPQHACACLFLLSEVLKARPPLWSMALQCESVDDELEHFEDVPDETETQPTTNADQEQTEITDAHTNSQVDAESNASEDEEGHEASSEEDVEDDDDEEELIIKKPDEGGNQSKSNGVLSDPCKNQELQTVAEGQLPGGYDPQHREPSFCKADRASWWELLVLGSHVHPSVSTMARTILSGANIVYNGNPLNDLSLTSFLDKFMEKKAKLNAWHGGSEIEPAKKLDMNHDLIGPEILSLAEEDVPPEDVVFHKFYMNKMHSTKKPKKKKKKAAEEEAAEDLYGGDNSDDEEIDDVLDVGGPPLEDADGDYDYNDLDRVAADEDDDLLADASDVEMEMPSDDDSLKHDVVSPNFGGGDSDGEIDVGDADDGSDDENTHSNRKKRKMKGGKKSPFASLEEYEHLLNDDEDGVQDDGEDDGDNDDDGNAEDKVRFMKGKPSRKRKSRKNSVAGKGKASYKKKKSSKE